MRQTPLSRIGKALSHPARIRMMWMLEEGERCGCEFAPEIGLDPSVVSRHLAVLARAGLVMSRRDGVRVLWRLADPEIPDALSRLVDLAREKEVIG